AANRCLTVPIAFAPRVFSSSTGICSRTRWAIATGAAAWTRRGSSKSPTNGRGAGTARGFRTGTTSTITARSQTCRFRPICSIFAWVTRCPQSTFRVAGAAGILTGRALYFYGLSPVDVQGQLPIVHPVIDHDYVFNSPIFGGELGFHNNLTSISRGTANFDAISQAALDGALCVQTADPALINRNNCV